MECRLVYRGPLVSNGNPVKKQALRRALHPQLKALWNQPPLNDDLGQFMDLLRQNEGAFVFAPLVSSKMNLVAELDVLFLRRQRAGDLVHHGGDIDNRMKTLLDSLRVPRANDNEIPSDDSPRADEDPFYCLLEDDALVTRLTITTDQLLEPGEASDVSVVIHVTIKDTGASRSWSFG